MGSTKGGDGVHRGHQGGTAERAWPLSEAAQGRTTGREIAWLLPSPALLSPPGPPTGHLRGLGSSVAGQGSATPGRVGITRNGSETFAQAGAAQ